MSSIVLCCTYLFVFFPLWISFINACWVDVKPKDSRVANRFFLSDGAPVTNVLNTIPGTADNAQLLVDHIRNVENAVYVARQTERTKSPANGQVTFDTCSYRDIPFRRAAGVKFGQVGWPLADTECVTDIFDENALGHIDLKKSDASTYTIDDVYFGLFKFRSNMKGNAMKFAAAVGFSNFTEIFSNPTHEITFSAGEKCILQTIGAVRFDDVWHLQAKFSIAIADQKPGGERRTIREFPTVRNGRFASPKKMCMQVNNNTDERKLGTTELRFSQLLQGGETSPSMFGAVLMEENPSIIESMEKLDKFVQQANDALAISNIAILVLPLLLNLVPIALLSSVTTSFMLFYTVLTDILTVIPLGIKGAELISIGSSAHRSVAVRLSSSVALPRSKSAGAVLWASECFAPSNVRSWGVFFLTLSLVFMVVGIVLEFLAQAYMKRKHGQLLTEFEEALPLHLENASKWNNVPLWHIPGKTQIVLPGARAKTYPDDEGNSLPQAALKSHETHIDDDPQERQSKDDQI